MEVFDITFDENIEDVVCDLHLKTLEDYYVKEDVIEIIAESSGIQPELAAIIYDYKIGIEYEEFKEIYVTKQEKNDEKRDENYRSQGVIFIDTDDERKYRYNKKKLTTIVIYGCIDIEYIKKYHNVFNWENISKFVLLQDEYICELSEYLNFQYISRYQKLDNSTIELFKDKLDWSLMSEYLILTDEIINKYPERIDWTKISEHQILSEEIIEKYIELIDIQLIYIYQTHLSDAFRDKILNLKNDIFVKDVYEREDFSFYFMNDFIEYI